MDLRGIDRKQFDAAMERMFDWFILNGWMTREGKYYSATPQGRALLSRVLKRIEELRADDCRASLPRKSAAFGVFMVNAMTALAGRWPSCRAGLPAA